MASVSKQKITVASDYLKFASKIDASEPNVVSRQTVDNLSRIAKANQDQWEEDRQNNTPLVHHCLLDCGKIIPYQFAFCNKCYHEHKVQKHGLKLYFDNESE